ncbi:uncharacterized protein LOC128551191 [Mercenaria mercenaria]|uniref:uncharacterized protein LOC128551191 n=1 Tax=Mercenaria mercenaria TaxID=6596 RepID=UPI00234EE339|nr:uncharacterized protein LOC128551191 [Mercenaria mercenaria]
MGVMLCQVNPNTDPTFRAGNWVEMKVYKTKIDLKEYEGTRWSDAVDSSDVQFISEKIFKISLLLEDNSLVMLAEGKKVGTLKLKTDFAAWRHIYISTLDGIKHPGYVHKIRYTKNAAEI